MLEGEDQGNSPRHLNEEDLTGDPSSDSTPIRLRAHSLPERHARTGRQGEPGGATLLAVHRVLQWHAHS